MPILMAGINRDGRDVIPRIQELKDIAAENVATRMMNNLLFGMRTRLPEDVFRECLGAMKASLKSWKHINTKLNLKVNICGADFSFCLSRAEGGDAAHR